jgi:hypothetical protein
MNFIKHSLAVLRCLIALPAGVMLSYLVVIPAGYYYAAYGHETQILGGYPYLCILALGGAVLGMTAMLILPFSGLPRRITTLLLVLIYLLGFYGQHGVSSGLTITTAAGALAGICILPSGAAKPK